MENGSWMAESRKLETENDKRKAGNRKIEVDGRKPEVRNGER
ncbi:MAG: hypothetical protein RRX93_08625 [Bacteroidales bacterium]